MNLEQIIARQEEEFTERFIKTQGIFQTEPIIYGSAPDVKDVLAWHSSSIKEILEGVVEREKDEKEKYEPAYEEVDKAYVASKQETINYLEEIIKKLDK